MKVFRKLQIFFFGDLYLTFEIENLEKGVVKTLNNYKIFKILNLYY